MKQPNNKRFIPFILLLCGALLVLAVSAAFLWGANVRPVKAQAGAQLQPSTATPTRWFVPSRTPFKPRTYTPTASPTATPTQTPTPTATPEPTATSTPEPTDPPPPPEPELPDQASVSGVVGHPQSLSLSCESRSASDWARFFGYDISELDFLGGLPRSDNPEEGFVGNPAGVPGQIPPGPYGVHAAPVAALLRAYGVPADDARGMSFDALRREIADGQPVIVWVIGGVLPGRSVTYEASNGQSVLVAPMEHTVIAVGYTADTVSVVDNHLYYTVSLDRFLSSWGVLGNQAVFYR